MPLPKKETLEAIQTVAIVAGAVLTVWQVHLGVDQLHAASDQVKIAAEASSATSLGILMNASRDLQWRMLADPNLQRLFLPDTKAATAAKGKKGEVLTDDDKVALFRGILISHYAFVYDYYKLHQIPDASWTSMRADMQEFFTKDDTKTRWDQVKSVFPGDFRDFVDHEILLKPK